MAAKTLDESQTSEASDQRRDQMLIAAAELIAERGFSETRIADVARRVGASPALVIYYFGTKDSLLTAALRYSEETFYTSCAEMLAKTPNTRDRLENLARMTCVPDADEGITGTWGLWFDLWAQAFRHPEVATRPGRARAPVADARSKTSSGRASKPATSTRVDPEEFAVTWAVLLDGLSIQVALRDEKVDPERAVTIAMQMAERELNLAAGEGNEEALIPHRERTVTSTSGRPFACSAEIQALICSAKLRDVGDEPVHVLGGVLDREQPLLDLAPRREEDAAVVLDQPVRLAVPAVDLQELAEVLGRLGQERDAALGACGRHMPRAGRTRR